MFIEYPKRMCQKYEQFQLQFTDSEVKLRRLCEPKVIFDHVIFDFKPIYCNVTK